jgi:MFS family permease
MAKARIAVLWAFVLQGVIIGTWAPRVPAVAAHVRADTGELGLALLGGGVGLIIVAPIAGRLCARFGARLVVTVAALIAAVMLPLLALVPTPALLGLVFVGLAGAVGAVDVSMNIAAVTVVRQIERPLMPVFHAGFSFGGLFGALGAALAATAGLDLGLHFGLVGLLAAVIIVVVARHVPNEPVLAVKKAARHGGRSPASRPVLWLLGATVLCAAVAEGASADWSSLFAVRHRGLSEAAGAIVYAGFSVSMAITRLLGERVERRWGPERMLVAGAAVAGGGLLFAVLIPAGWASFVGFALAGAGLAYTFPMGLGLAGAAGRRADGSGGERELAFVTAVAYSGFLLGPPMIGWIAQVTNLAVALGVAGLVAAMMGPGVLAARWARRREVPDQVEPARPRTAPVP